ncbi:MAG: hypothetical protein H7336_13575 [Bacteriovorax sp.]|nr:hypothetical protein [Bacteriovorax sp.]
MAECSTRAKINFIKLKQEELSSKIALLVSENGRIIFWKAAPRYYEGKATCFDIRQNKTYLTIGDCNIHRRLTNERVCLNFTINDIDYFLRGMVVEQMEENLQMVIELEDECFRVEKRNRERLHTYPVYEVYAYLKYQKQKTNNVVFFNKKEQQTTDFFSEIDNIQKNKLQSLTNDLHMEESEDLVGFRVEDLSSSGLSFFANTKEKEHILDAFGDKKFTMILNFEMQVFNLEDANIVYKINYINSQFSGVPMYKIGINFKLSPVLKRKIEDHSGITVDMVDYQKEFEEFIKNE